MKSFYSHAHASEEAAEILHQDPRDAAFWDFVDMLDRQDISADAGFTLREQADLCLRDWQQICERDQTALSRAIRRWKSASERA